MVVANYSYTVEYEEAGVADEVALLTDWLATRGVETLEGW